MAARRGSIGGTGEVQEVAVRGFQSGSDAVGDVLLIKMDVVSADRQTPIVVSFEAFQKLDKEVADYYKEYHSHLAANLPRIPAFPKSLVGGGASKADQKMAKQAFQVYLDILLSVPYSIVSEPVRKFLDLPSYELRAKEKDLLGKLQKKEAAQKKALKKARGEDEEEAKAKPDWKYTGLSVGSSILSDSYGHSKSTLWEVHSATSDGRSGLVVLPLDGFYQIDGAVRAYFKSVNNQDALSGVRDLPARPGYLKAFFTDQNDKALVAERTDLLKAWAASLMEVEDLACVGRLVKLLELEAPAKKE